jgi:hypothetical protein
MASAGMQYTPPSKYVKVDRRARERIAQAYEEMKHAPQDPDVKAAYEALAERDARAVPRRDRQRPEGRVHRLRQAGRPVRAQPAPGDRGRAQNNHMWVFSTRDGFGSSEFDPRATRCWSETEFEISGKIALVNDLFRVVHDYFGHVKEGNGFRADGEENAWRSHRAMFTPRRARR